MPFLKVGRPEARRLAHLHTHRPAEHGAADQRAYLRDRTATLSLPLLKTTKNH